MNKLETFDIKLLYVEDEEDIREELEDFFSFRFKEVLVAKNGEEGLKMYREHRPDIVVTDVMMPKMNGLDMIKAIREEFGDIPVVVMTAFRKSDTNMEMIQEIGVYNIISKPADPYKVIDVIKKALEE